MQNTTQLYRQLFLYLSQYSQHCDLRHLQALSWMVSALVCSQKLNLTAWEPYVHEGCSKSPELPAPLESISEQLPYLCQAAISATGDGGLESVGQSTAVCGAGHELARGTNTA